MTGRRTAVLTAALLVAYLAMSAGRAVDFIQAGGVAPVGLGMAILILPPIGLWALASEWRFGRATQELGAALSQRGELPVDDLPRRPSGRPVRAAADARFVDARARVEADPGAWEPWFELATAYDACGDRRRARAAMRRAIALHAGRGGGVGVRAA
ncbi:MAG: hypothetical protein WCF04_07370 [Candidatus Nanopelagicales bacterium]